MSNLRIVSKNATDFGTTTVSSTASASLAAENLRVDTKALVYRAKSTSVRVSHSFASAELIGLAGLIHSNLSPTATMRVRLSNEAAAAQLVPYSEHLWATGWVATNVTVNANGALAPDRISGAARIVGNGVSGSHTIARSLTIVLDTQYTVSLFAKAGTNSWLYVDFSGGGGGYSTFNIGTGQLGATLVGGVTARSITPVVDMPGWYRISITVTPTTATTTRTISISTQNVDSGTSTSTAGDAYYWGVNVTPGPLTSYYPSDITFTSRASTATYLDANGVVTGALSGVGRTTYQYPTLAAVAPRVLVEPAAFNAMLYSAIVSNAIYTKGNVTIGSSATAPDNTSAALAVMDTSANTLHYLQQVVALNTATAYTLSTWVKSIGRTRMQLANATLGAFAKFNIDTGVVVTGGGTGYLSSTIDPYPGGWYRISITFLTNASSSQSMILYLEDNVTGSTSYANGSTGVYSWGWQLEAGYFPTSYIPTTSASANRAADNFTSTASTRPQGYIDWWQSYAYDTGAVLCCPAPAAVIEGYTATQSASLYQYGGGAHARAWLPQTQGVAVAMTIDIVDNANLQGYVEFSRLVCGQYWEPTKNADYGASVVPFDMSKVSRSDSGDRVVDISPSYDKLSFTLSKMDPVDRTKAWNLFQASGIRKPMFISFSPNDADTTYEAMGQIYGGLVTVPSMRTPFFNLAEAALEIEGV